MRLRYAATVIVVLLAGCGSASEPGSSSPKQKPSVPAAKAVRATWAQLPSPSKTRYIVQGTYLQLAGSSGLELVNSALRNLVVKDSQDAERHADQSPDVTTTVTYSRGTVFVNAAIVSVLQPVTFEREGGATIGEYWVAGSWLLKDATEIKMRDLFADPTGAWSDLGTLARQALRIGDNKCTAAMLDDSSGTVDWSDPELYRNFVMSTEGIRIGFDKYAVAAGACGPAEITLAWQVLEPLLGTVGRSLESKVTA